MELKNSGWLSKSGRPVRRSVQYFLLGGLMTFATIWVFAKSWVANEAGLNENWFHEFLLLFMTIFAWIWGYFNIYQKSNDYQAVLEKQKAEEAAEVEAKKEAERKVKEDKFDATLANFQQAQSYTQKKEAMGALLEIGLESHRLRQKVVDSLGPLNQWMRENELYLEVQNLLLWRLKGKHFEVTSRFREDSETQDLGMKAINVIEAIIKRHVKEFNEEIVTFPLDLTDKAVPSLTLSGKTLNGKSLILKNTILWQASFSESHLTDMNFEDCDLSGASFWRADLKNINFKGAELDKARLRNNLQECTGITPEQFFDTKEWELCFLSNAQELEMFPEEVRETLRWQQWKMGGEKRKKLYFGIVQI